MSSCLVPDAGVPGAGVEAENGGLEAKSWIKEVAGDLGIRFGHLHMKGAPAGESFITSRNWLVQGQQGPKMSEPQKYRKIRHT